MRKIVRFGLEEFGSVRKSSVRFGLVRFGSEKFGSEKVRYKVDAGTVYGTNRLSIV